MPIRNLFKKKSTDKEKAVKMEPGEMPEPGDVEGYMRRGWAFHTKGNQAEAEADFKQALALDADSVDAYYALGLTKKAQGQNEAALEYFHKAMNLIEAGKVKEGTQLEMLRRLTLGHINELTDGDWNLEDEIWRH
jgi:tetratricopeptide (TPR) repeat protein